MAGLAVNVAVIHDNRILLKTDPRPPCRTPRSIQSIPPGFLSANVVGAPKWWDDRQSWAAVELPSHRFGVL